MERNLRIAAPIAGGALAISLLVGLVAGVPFGIALLRAFLSGGVFGIFALGVAFLMRTQLGGVEQQPTKRNTDVQSGGVESGSSDSQGSDSSQAGSRLNIVVEDEDEPASFDRSAGEEAADHGSDTDAEAAELVEEVAESSADDEQAVMSAAISEEQDGTSVEIDDTMLDEMPDIGSFAGSFVSGEESESDETENVPEETGGFTGGTKQKAGDPRKGFDNKTVAKAIQTFMEKDNE